MFALRVRINNEAPVTGGADDLGVITVNVTGAGLLGPNSVRSRPDESLEFFCHLGGLTARGTAVEDVHLLWLQQHNLKLGDKVTIEIVEVDSASPIVGSKIARQRESPQG